MYYVLLLLYVCTYFLKLGGSVCLAINHKTTNHKPKGEQATSS